MATFINKTTLAVRDGDPFRHGILEKVSEGASESSRGSEPIVNGVRLADPDWFVDPDLSDVKGVPRRYWKLGATAPARTGKAYDDLDMETVKVLEMAQPEKDQVDTQLAADRLEADKQEAKNEFPTNRLLKNVVIEMLQVMEEVKAGGDVPSPSVFRDRVFTRIDNQTS